MEIVDKAKLFVIDFYGQHRDEKLHFHSLEHTINVVRKAEDIGMHMKLGDPELRVVLTAAWFHDIGYLVRLEDHEDASVALARSFFEGNPAEPGFAEAVEDCINATKRDHEPLTVPEKVIMDADVAHIGDDQFISISKKLRKERSCCQNTEVPALDYWQGTLAFLERHHFYTEFAQEHYQPVKQQNIDKVKEIIAKLEIKAKNPAKARSTDKGTESMFRLTASNQMRLSAIADKKANILISINSILISFSAAMVSRKPLTLLTNDFFLQGDLVVPMIVLFIFSLLSLVFAILSCRPKLSSGDYREEDLKERKVNLLFFGIFHRIPYPRYDQAVKEMMNDYNYLYTNLIRDQYFLGQSLFRKYKLLRMAYNIFMYGFIFTALVFAVFYVVK